MVLVPVSQLAFAGSVLEVNVSDFQGPANGHVLYSIWDEGEDSYVPLHSRYLNKGSDRIGLAPGTYQVRIIYTDTWPTQEQVDSGLEIGDGEEWECEFYFHKGVAKFQARDNDWCWRADSRIHLYRWDEGAGKFERIRSRWLPDKKTKDYIALAPGKYKASIQYLETRPQIEGAETEFEITDGELVSILGLFKHGSMPIRRKHAPLLRRSVRPVLAPNEALTERTDNKG